MGLGRLRRRSGEPPFRDLLIGASAKQAPTGRSVVFQSGFVDPPKVGSLILLSRQGKQSIAVTRRKSIGQGEGAVASEEVLEALGCSAKAIDVSVTFRAATFRDWLGGGDGAILIFVSWLAEFIIAAITLSIGVLAAADTSQTILFTIGSLSALAFIGECVLAARRFRSLPAGG